MIYRIVASLILVAALFGALALSDEGSSSTSGSAPASAGPDDSAMKSLRIDQ